MKINNQVLDENSLNQYIIGNSKMLNKWFLKKKPFVDLIITSPPYWDTKDYEGNENQIGFKQSYENYLNDVKTIFDGTYNISKKTASLVLVVDTLKKGGKMIRLPDDTARILEEIGWIHQDTIIWDKVKTLPWSRKGQMRNIFEYILIFSKTKNYKYNIDEIRLVEDLKEWWIGYPERYNPQGKVPENIWPFLIPTQGSWGTKQDFDNEEFRHACPFPPELMARIIKLLSDPDDVVFDPFAGTGVLFSVAEKLNRRFLGIDVNDSYKSVYEKVTRPLVNSMWPEIERYYEIQRKLKELLNKTITKLRILKYPYALMRKQRAIKDFKLAIILRKEFSDSDNINEYIVGKVELDLYLNQEVDYNNVKTKCNELLSKAPFTKYGLISKHNVFLFSELNNHLKNLDFPLYLYSGSDFSQYHTEINTRSEFIELIQNEDRLESLKDSNVCAVVSNVKIQKNDYCLLPAEQYQKVGYRDKYPEELLNKISQSLE